MNEFLKHIYQILSAIGETYHPDVEQGADFPYIQFGTPTDTADYQRDMIILEVDVWDNQPDTMGLEDLADEVEAALDRYKYFKNGAIQTSIYKLTRLPIPDPNENIHRRQIRFECKTYL